MRPTKGLPQSYYDNEDRNEIAEKSLYAILSSNRTDLETNELARLSYQIADAMLKQRNK